MEGQRRARRGETGSCCVRGGQGGSNPVARVDVRMICDEYLYDLKVISLAGPVEGCVPALTRAGELNTMPRVGHDDEREEEEAGDQQSENSVRGGESRMGDRAGTSGGHGAEEESKERGDRQLVSL